MTVGEAALRRTRKRLEGGGNFHLLCMAGGCLGHHTRPGRGPEPVGGWHPEDLVLILFRH